MSVRMAGLWPPATPGSRSSPVALLAIAGGLDRASGSSGRAPRCSPWGGLIKCAGAPQKSANLAEDYRRRQGVLDQIDAHLVLPTTRERKDMWLLKKYGPPALYWNLMLKGRA